MTAKGGKMTTIKVSVETAAALANTVRRLKAQGQKKMTADRLLRQIIQEKFPEEARLTFGDAVLQGEANSSESRE